MASTRAAEERRDYEDSEGVNTRPASATGSNRNLMRQQEVQAPTNTTKTSTEPVTNFGPTIGSVDCRFGGASKRLVFMHQPYSRDRSPRNSACAALQCWNVARKNTQPTHFLRKSAHCRGLSAPAVVRNTYRIGAAFPISAGTEPRIVSFA